MRPGNICPSAGKPRPLTGGCGGLPEASDRTALPQGAETPAAEASAAARDTEGAVEQAAAPGNCHSLCCDPDSHQRPGLSVLRSSSGSIQQGRHRGRLPVDDLARAELEQALEELRAVSVPDEPNPAKINWNC